MKALSFVLLGPLLAWSAGCTSPYMSATAMKRLERGPAACEKRCKAIGMRMGALALIDASHTGCVCVPEEPAPPAPRPASQGAPPAWNVAPAPVESAPEAPAQPAEVAPEATPQAQATENHAAVIAGAGAIIAEQELAQQAASNAQRAKLGR